MGRPKVYANAAEKHRAYRARRAAEMILVNRESLLSLEARVAGLEASVRRARQAGCPIAAQISANSALDGLTAWFGARAAGSHE